MLITSRKGWDNFLELKCVPLLSSQTGLAVLLGEQWTLMDSDEGEGESTNEGLWRGGRGECLYILNHGRWGGTLWRGSPCLLITACWSILQRGKRREKISCGGQKSTTRVRRVFYVLSKLTFLLTFNFWSLMNRDRPWHFSHSIIDDVFVVFLNVQS